MGNFGPGRRGATRVLAPWLVAALCSSALVPVAHAAQFNVLAPALNGGAGDSGSAAWAFAQANNTPGSHVVDFDQSTNLTLIVPQAVLKDITLQINKHLRVDAALSGTGNIIKTGTGYLAFSANSTATSNFDIRQGGVVVWSGDAINDNAAVTMASGTEFETIGSETIGSLSGRGALMGSDNGGNVLTLGGNGASTSFEFEAPTDNLLGNDACYILSLVKTGAGTFTITGAVPLEGTLTVAGGKVVVNTALGMDATVQSGTTLGGTGSLNIVAINGILAPGNSIGTIQVSDATFNSGSVLQIEIAPGGTTPGVHNDFVDASGAVTINGGVVEIVGANGDYSSLPSYTILTAANGVTGQFEGVRDDLAFYDAALSYDANNVYAALSFSGYAGGGRTPNQQAAGRGLDSVGGSSPYASQLANLSGSAGTDALDQLSGEGHASHQPAMIDQTSHTPAAAFDRVDQAFAALEQQSAASNYLPSRLQGEPAAMTGIWGSVHGGVVQRAATGGTLGSSSQTSGLVMGLDGEVAPDWRLGLLASAGLGRITAGNLTGNSSTVGAGVYLGGQAGIVDIKLGAAYSRHFVQSSRAVTFGGLSDTLSAQYQAGTTQLFGEVSHEFDLGATSITPFGQVTVLRHDAEAFTETGGAGALSTAASSSVAAHTMLGIAADYAFVLGDTVLGTVGVSAGWEHVFGGDASVTNTFVVGGSSFVVSGTPVVRDTLRLGGELSFDLSANLALSATYDGRIGDGLTAHHVAAQFAGRF